MLKQNFDLKRESKIFRQLITEGAQIASFPPRVLWKRWDDTAYILELPKSRLMTTPKANEFMKERKLQSQQRGKQNGTATL